jgi:hypothetical protein
MNDAAGIPLWPQERLGDALQAVARALGLARPDGARAHPGISAAVPVRDAEVARWLRAAAGGRRAAQAARSTRARPPRAA